MGSEETEGGAARGRLSDGETAAAREVSVTLIPSGLEVVEPPSGAARHWPYATLDSAEPLHVSSGDVLLTSTADRGMALFVADPAFVRALTARAPQLGTGARRWRHARPWIAIAVLLAAVTITFNLLDISLPRAIASVLPDKLRSALGEDALQAITGRLAACHSAEGDRALDLLTARLSTGAEGAKFRIVVVDWSLFNAFAVPGEQIMLTRGLIAKAKSPDEVAGVLAHEMGHGLARDPEAGLIRALGLSAFVRLITGGSDNTLANMGLVLAQLSYTRGAERQADATALRLLKAARVSPRGLASFFAQASALEGKSDMGALGGILTTHPASEERQKLALAQVTYPTTPSLSDTDWKALRAICGASGSQGGKP